MRLYLIRHAQAQMQPEQDVKTWLLSTTGQRQAEQLATLPMWNAVTQLVVSSEVKTRLTVAPVIAQRRLPVQVDPRFDELQRPGWTDDYATQVQRAFADPTQAAGDWEPAAVALARFQAGIAALCQHFADTTIALVGHGLTFSLYRAHLLGHERVRFADWQQLAFAAVALVDPVMPQLLADFRPLDLMTE
ncbi:MAG: histidine phosphatase family protein [Caldilinea sp. CFX5]|nr:histidine phosphatase family protein [Caldilinea sp. CFX5]